MGVGHGRRRVLGGLGHHFNVAPANDGLREVNVLDGARVRLLHRFRPFLDRLAVMGGTRIDGLGDDLRVLLDAIFDGARVLLLH